MLHVTPLFLAAALAGGPDTTIAQPLFAEHHVLELRITTDLRTLLRDIGRDRGDFQFEGEEEHDGVLSYVDETGDSIQLWVELKTRGHSRRDPDVCRFPPLRLDLPRAEVAGTLFDNQDKIKLFTHCRNDRDRYEQSVIQEYLIYRTYGILTDKSFRVRLARINYVDAVRDDSLVRYAMLEENEDLMAARLGSEIMDLDGLHPLDTEYESGTTLALFQFMIMNTDWEVSAQQNIKLVGPLDGTVYAVPRDFDMAGVIDPPYGAPDPHIGIRSLRDRRYRGFCRSETSVQTAIALFNARRGEIYDMHRTQDGLDPELLDRMLRDYDRFYDIINDPEQLRRHVEDRCRRR